MENTFRRNRITGTFGKIDEKALSDFNKYSCFFDGIDEYTNIGNMPELSFERTDPFSLACWIKTTYIGASSIIPIGKRNNAGIREGYSLAYRAGSSEFIVVFANDDPGGNKIDKRFNQDTIINDNAWHCLCLTYDGSSDASGILMYVDTISQSQKSVINSLTASMLTTQPFNIGSRNGLANYWLGNIDEVSVWNKGLNVNEINEIYNFGKPKDLRSHSAFINLVGWWLMGDYDIFPTITDRSVNGNNGTMINMESSDVVEDVP